MKKIFVMRLALFPIILMVYVIACRPGDFEQAKDRLLAKDNLIAWCVVPFDSVNRSPSQRAQMLSDLGFTKFAYDWRVQHLPTFGQEIRAMKSEGIELSAIWIWVAKDSTRLWDEMTDRVLNLIEEHGVKTRLWVGYESDFFAGLSEDDKLKKAVESVDALRDRADQIDCTISLYNHGDWFGDPENQIRIIEELQGGDVGIVYNFHHAHEQIDRYPELLQEMLPYVTTVNINGMRKEGPKILPVGKGDLEGSMLRALIEAGYEGTIGILGHVEDADVRVILNENLEGLSELKKKL